MARTRNQRVNAVAGLTLSQTGFTMISEDTTGTPTDYHTLIRFQGTLGAIAGGAALGLGRMLLTWPVGPCIVLKQDHIKASVKGVAGNSANVPTIGVGTVVASGAVSVLSGTSTFQNAVTGIAAADSNGSVAEQVLAPQLTFLPGASSRSLFFNVAATWSVADPAARIYGEYRVNWCRFG